MKLSYFWICERSCEGQQRKWFKYWRWKFVACVRQNNAQSCTACASYTSPLGTKMFKNHWLRKNIDQTIQVNKQITCLLNMDCTDERLMHMHVYAKCCEVWPSWCFERYPFVTAKSFCIHDNCYIHLLLQSIFYLCLYNISKVYCNVKQKKVALIRVNIPLVNNWHCAQTNKFLTLPLLAWLLGYMWLAFPRVLF